MRDILETNIVFLCGVLSEPVHGSCLIFLSFKQIFLEQVVLEMKLVIHSICIHNSEESSEYLIWPHWIAIRENIWYDRIAIRDISSNIRQLTLLWWPNQSQIWILQRCAISLTFNICTSFWNKQYPYLTSILLLLR